jgi:transposase
MQITTIGLDLAKRVLQVHAVDAAGRVVVRKALRRAQVLPFFAKLPPCLVGMEACGTSHHWARKLIGLGHEVRLMPPAYVKPYVKRGKTDAADAEAICEAVTRPTMRFVPVKSREQQAALSMHRARNLLVKQRTQLVNMVRGLLAEFGIDMPAGLERALQMARRVVEGCGSRRAAGSGQDRGNAVAAGARHACGTWRDRSRAPCSSTKRRDGATPGHHPGRRAGRRDGVGRLRH